MKTQGFKNENFSFSLESNCFERRYIQVLAFCASVQSFLAACEEPSAAKTTHQPV